MGCLTEGMSLRATTRVTGAAKNTVTKLLIDLGEAGSTSPCCTRSTAAQDEPTTNSGTAPPSAPVAAGCGGSRRACRR